MDKKFVLIILLISSIIYMYGMDLQEEARLSQMNYQLYGKYELAPTVRWETLDFPPLIYTETVKCEIYKPVYYDFYTSGTIENRLLVAKIIMKPTELKNQSKQMYAGYCHPWKRNKEDLSLFYQDSVWYKCYCLDNLRNAIWGKECVNFIFLHNGKALQKEINEGFYDQ